MSVLQNFIQEYGYLTVFLGAMIEGESVILTASALASTGILSIWGVAALTFTGTLLADQIIYFIGTHYGPSSVQALRRRFPSWKENIDKALDFAKRNETIYILSFRFIYGIRIISPFIIGAQGISFQRFSILNVLSAGLWTAISCALGYFLGHLLGDKMDHIEWVVLGVVTAVIVISHLLSKKKNS